MFLKRSGKGTGVLEELKRVEYDIIEYGLFIFNVLNVLEMYWC